MGRQVWLADVARAAGLNVKEVDGWQTRGKDTFAPQGTVWHHTGDGAGEMPTLRTLVVGRSDLPGPLCNYGLGRSGTVYVVASGRANHAGVGTWHGLAGNSYFVGIEAENSGGAGDPWPAAQLDAYFRLTAAIQAHLNKDESYVCGHKEYATPHGRKNDPHTLDMNAVRKKVDALMRGQNPVQEDDDMLRVVQCNDHPGALYLTNGLDSVRTLSASALTHGRNLGVYPKDTLGVPHDWITWVDQNQDGHNNPDTP